MSEAGGSMGPQAYSNMPVMLMEAAGPGAVVSIFQPTPPISSYLFAFALTEGMDVLQAETPPPASVPIKSHSLLLSRPTSFIVT